MRDIPLFTATNGMATLILHEIPFRGDAFVWIRTVYGSLEGLLKECEGFCRAAGADRVYFSGEIDLSAYSVYLKSVFSLSCSILKCSSKLLLQEQHQRMVLR